MKKLPATGAAALLCAALGVAALWLPWRAPRPAAERLDGACRGDGPLLAGAAEVPLDLPPPLSIGGFAKLRWTAAGVRDPVAARALVLAEPGCSVGLVSVEILLVPGALARAVEARVKDLGLFHLVIAATHTHAGPGGYWDSLLGERIATGPYDPATFARLADALAQALRAAHAARRPARLEAGAGPVRDLAFSRALGEVEGRLVSLRFRAEDGRPIGELALLGVHATMLGIRNRLISGDWPGAMMRGRPAPLLFFQGALGDQKTRTPTPESEGVDGYGRVMAARLDALSRSAPDPRPVLAAARATAALPLPSPGAAPAWLRPAARTLFGGSLPAEAPVSAVRLGPVLLLASPAEPVAALGASWRAAAGPGAEILALANDYVGYVETAARTEQREGEAVRTYYGPELAIRLEAALLRAAAAVR